MGPFCSTFLFALIGLGVWILVLVGAHESLLTSFVFDFKIGLWLVLAAGAVTGAISFRFLGLALWQGRWMRREISPVAVGCLAACAPYVDPSETRRANYAIEHIVQRKRKPEPDDWDLQLEVPLANNLSLHAYYRHTDNDDLPQRELRIVIKSAHDATLIEERSLLMEDGGRDFNFVYAPTSPPTTAISALAQSAATRTARLLAHRACPHKLRYEDPRRPVDAAVTLALSLSPANAIDLEPPRTAQLQHLRHVPGDSCATARSARRNWRANAEDVAFFLPVLAWAVLGCWFALSYWQRGMLPFFHWDHTTARLLRTTVEAAIVFPVAAGLLQSCYLAFSYRQPSAWLPIRYPDAAATLLIAYEKPMLRMPATGARIDLSEPFEIELTRSSEEDLVWLQLEIRQSAPNPRELVFRFAARLEAEGKLPPVAPLEGPIVDEEAVRDWLWPLLRQWARKHDLVSGWITDERWTIR